MNEEKLDEIWSVVMDLGVVSDNWYLMSDEARKAVVTQARDELKQLYRELDAEGDERPELEGEELP